MTATLARRVGGRRSGDQASLDLVDHLINGQHLGEGHA
jgi:hypothetical protein